ncbi:MAG: hypothetical protein R3263_03960, partial [Myxococcota bacterium]|nr:hypothetical protein [Myxococcota bacterium]
GTAGDGAGVEAPTAQRAVGPGLRARHGVAAPGMPEPVARPEALVPVEAELLGRKAEGEGYDDLRALREGPLKLILEAHGPELYDLAADPHERRDLADARPQDVARLAREIAALGSAAARTGGTAPLSPEELERLRALGYAE